MISVERVSVEVEDRTLLPPVDLTGLPGEIWAVRGPNGSGKSTLLRALGGLLEPTLGNVTIDGRRPDRAAPWFRQSVAVMLDQPPFARDLTVAEHLGLVLLTWYGASNLDENVDKHLTRWGLLDSRLRFPHELSSGQRQLLALGILLARPSKVLIVDEPEQRLDSTHVEALSTQLRAHAQTGAVIVMATHSDLLEHLTAARVIRLDEQ